MYEDIIQNVAQVRRRMAAAAQSASRDVKGITLVAATKTMPAAAVRAAISAGVDACGENRVQEMTAKGAENAYEGAPLHFIGHLQKNKVRQVVGTADLIESVDSPALLALIGRRAGELGIVQRVLLEVNIGNEASKSGLPAAALPEVLRIAGDIPQIKVLGLMAIPPISAGETESLSYFEEMHQLFVDIRSKKYDNVSMEVLSMGMSSDFEYAIRAGATMIRVGTAIFGARDYGVK